MTDNLLSSPDQEEALSRAYVQAIAGMAGYMTAEYKPDRDGTDVQIRAGGSMRPSLDIQLKATINLKTATDGQFRYSLKLRNYNLLRVPTQVPNILVVLALPQNSVDWLSVTPEQLIMRRCAYWVSLKGYPETQNKESVTISIKETSRFDVTGLKDLMNQARTGTIG